MTATYHALFCDLRTDQVIDRFPIAAVSIEDYIGKTGSMIGTLTAPDQATAARITTAVVPGRTAVWIERDRDIWWAGIVWTVALNATTRQAPAQAEIQAATFGSYLSHRLLTADITVEGLDQFALARRLVEFVQTTDGGDTGIQLDDQRSGVTRTRRYSRYDLPRIRDLLDQLAAADNGFEWRVHPYRDDAGNRAKQLRLGHPRITTARGAAETVLDYPGPVTSYRLPYDATTRATHWLSRGATTPSTNRPLLSTGHYIRSATAAGWPRLDGTSDYTTVTSRRPGRARRRRPRRGLDT